MSNFIHGAKGVGDMVDRDEFGAVREEVLEGVEVEGSVVADGDHFQGYSQSFTKHLPGDGVGMVFQSGDDDFVTGHEVVGSSQGGGDEVDGIGGAGSEDDFFGSRGIEVCGDGFPGGFVGCGCGLGKVMDAAMDV